MKHSDMRKVYVDLLGGGFAMLCAFFVYHDLGYKGSDDLGCEHFDIDKFLCKGYELFHVVCRRFQMLNLVFKYRISLRFTTTLGISVRPFRNQTFEQLSI